MVSNTLQNTEFTVAQYLLAHDASLTIRETLPFAEQFRRALISHCNDAAHSETITGKTVTGQPLAGHLHAHYFATDEDHDGKLDHITIYAPSGIEREDLSAFKAIRSITRFDQHWKVGTAFVGFGTPTSFESKLFGKTTRWRSVTPFSLPRFANRGGGKPPRPRDLPEAQLVRELRLRGLPEPVSIKRTEGYEVNGRPIVRWLEFHTRRFKGDEGFGLAGFELEFAEPVAGPLALGFGCHFSLGLFLPAE